MSEGQSPRVGIGLSAFNDVHYVSESIESLLAQEFKDFELILSDDNSTDGTADVCRKYADQDPRIRFFRQPRRQGIVNQANFVFRQTRAPFFAWTTCQHLWRPDFISRLLPILENNPTVVCSYPLIPVIDSEGKVISNPAAHAANCWVDTRALNVVSRLNIALWSASGCNPGGGIFRSDALRQTRLIRPVIAPDNLMLFELSLIGAIACVHEELLISRKTSPSKHLRDVLERYKTVFYAEDDPMPRYFRMWLTHWRLFYEHLAAVLRSAHSPRRKPVMLASTVFGFMARHTKHMIHDGVQALGLPRP